MKRLLLHITMLLFFGTIFVSAQTGISVGPPRTYFITAPGETQTKKLLVSNPSKTGSMNLTVSFNDWAYDSKGNNVISDPRTLPTSLSEWITILPQTFFTLGPGESTEIELRLTTPPQASPEVPVHTALLYITQTNSNDSFNEQGALFKVSVRTGVKIYHRYSGMPPRPDITFTNFRNDKQSNSLVLNFENRGNTWTDGPLQVELISQSDGSTIKLEDQVIYTMPNDQRELAIKLPNTLKKGKYIATVTFTHAENDIIKMAELSFTHE